VRLRSWHHFNSKAAFSGPASTSIFGGQSGLRDRWNKSGQGFGYTDGREAERTGFALVGDPPIDVDDVQAIRPTRVGAFRGIVKRVHHRREFQAEVANTHLPEIAALVKTLRTRKYNLVRQITGHLPDVARVRFLDVHDVERNLIFIFLVQRIQRGNLPAKRRSGIAAEYEHDRFLPL
jgi:hypothetical protein